MKDKYFLYVGNAYPHKNLDLLLHALSEVTDAKLILVGKDDYFYKRLRESDIAKQFGTRIVFKTDVSDSELRDLYEHAQAFVFPSLMEGFGLPALEALANNCPVIVSDIPVFHEILGDVPKYFDPHNEKVLTESLKNPPLRSKSFQEKSARVAQQYSWKKMATDTIRVYDQATR
jgi:glycosyltransferase involved in cell wall biosynthesis